MKLILSVFSFRTPLLKSILIMKMVFFLLVASCIQVQAAGQKMSLSKINAPLKEIFKSIEQQSGYLFIYESAIIKRDMKATVRMSDKDIKSILDECLKEKPLKYTIMDKNILIEETFNVVAKVESPIAIITGVVLNTDGNPLEGASVKVKGKDVGMMTKGDGQFSLNAEIGDVIVVSFIGYTAREIKISSDKRLVIRLENIDQKMDNIIISTGVFQRPEGNFTGATNLPQVPVSTSI